MAGGDSGPMKHWNLELVDSETGAWTATSGSKNDADAQRLKSIDEHSARPSRNITTLIVSNGDYSQCNQSPPFYRTCSGPGWMNIQCLR